MDSIVSLLSAILLSGRPYIHACSILVNNMYIFTFYIILFHSNCLMHVCDSVRVTSSSPKLCTTAIQSVLLIQTIPLTHISQNIRNVMLIYFPDDNEH